VVAPARFPECIAVAATNIQDRPWTGSSRGGEVDVAAPGESVWVADIRLNESPPRYDVSRHSGTSFAVTLVAATAALWLARHGRDQLIARYGRNRLQATFLHLVRTVGRRRPEGWDGGRFGAGIIDARALLSEPLPAPGVIADAPAADALPVSDPLGKLNGLVPELAREELAERLGGLLRVGRAELDGQLDRFGAELAYLLSEDATLRRRLGATVPAGVAGDEPRRADDLAQLASPTLAHQVTATGAADQP
jgi:subtilisin family serine protease